MPRFVRSIGTLGPFLAAITWFLSASAVAQNDVENVIVEVYYISNALDATESDGGVLAEGSTTYRVYLDLCDSCSLLAVYGSAAHPLEIASTAPFYNNADRGKTFGHELNNSALDENTVALDSWLSFGAASNQRFGILKTEDQDGITDELFPNDLDMLANNDAAAGIPLTEADGLLNDPDQSPTPGTFSVVGDSPDSLFKDSTAGMVFYAENMRISAQEPGVRGHGVGNKLLVAQLTTMGELTFCLNVEIRRADGTVARYVHNDTLLAPDETPFGLLCYPPACGCTDPNFLEYDPTAGCDDGSCQTEIIFGCLDPNACNYDPSANFNITALCCYGPDSCNGLDPDLICPDVGEEELAGLAEGFQVLGNPFADELSIAVAHSTGGSITATILDMSGRAVLIHTWQVPLGRNVLAFNTPELPPGAYVLRLTTLAGTSHGVVVKR